MDDKFSQSLFVMQHSKCKKFGEFLLNIYFFLAKTCICMLLFYTVHNTNLNNFVLIKEFLVGTVALAEEESVWQ